MKTCVDCKECKMARKFYVCVAEDERVRLPIINFRQDMSDCALFEVT